MGNGLILLAGIFGGLGGFLSFISIPSDRFKKTKLILWGLSCAMIASAVILMVALLICNKFEYSYVYSHISLDMALVYKISALWAGQEGSFLLWGLILSLMGFFVLQMKGNRVNQVFGIYSAISFCVYLMCFIVQPFKQMITIPPDGLGLAETLKDPWMVIHPPLVFISYSAMAVLFSLCATISKNGSFDSSGWIFPWLRISWIFLGFGILSGSIWAYRALGWGSYWAWDPIENAALVPWLLLCGYLHYKKCNPYQICIMPFSIACFGVFLARSGILKDQSAHAYTDGNAIITGIILCFIFGTLLFLVSKKKKTEVKNTDRAIANHAGRQIFYLLCGYAALIFIGTLSPLIFGIETPVLYYTAISIAFAFAYSILLLLQDLEHLKKRSILMAVISMMLVVGIIAVSDSDQFGWLAILWVCLMPFSLWLSCGFPKSWKYYLPHLGVLLLIVGAIASSGLSREGFAVAAPDRSQIVISGVSIPLSELSQKDILIKNLPAEDLIIQCSKITALPQGGALIPYETRPLILLFWVGGFIIIFAPLSLIISNEFKKYQLLNKNGCSFPLKKA